jgi:hypothetical protein
MTCAPSLSFRSARRLIRDRKFLVVRMSTATWVDESELESLMRSGSQ